MNAPARGRLGALAARVRESRALVTLAALAAGFGAMTAAIRAPGLRPFDARVSRRLQRRGSRRTLAAARFLTDLGNGPGLAALSAPVLVWAVRTRRPRAATLLLAAIGGHVLNKGMKTAFRRPRPNGDEDRVTVHLPARGTSFPSGHAMTAVLYFGFLGFLIYAYAPNRALRLGGVGASSGVALAICWSRVYSGAHFLSDVIGGIAAGGFFLVSWGVLYRRFAAAELLPAADRPRLP